MPENEFEKQVQQKMDELRFDPSAVVWDEVEKQISARKKRRLLFIWLPFLFLLAGSTAWLYHSVFGTENKNQYTLNKKNDSSLTENKNQNSVAVIKEADKREIKTKKEIKINTGTLPLIKKNTENNSLADNGNNKKSTETIINANRINNIVSQRGLKDPLIIHNTSNYPKSSIGIKGNSSHTNHVSNNAVVWKKNHTKMNAGLQKKESVVADEDVVITNSTASKKENDKPAETITHDTDLPANISAKDSSNANDKHAVAKIKEADSVKNKTKADSVKAIAKTKPAGKKKQIEWGGSLNAGVSKIFDGFSGLLTSTVPSYDPASFVANQFAQSPSSATTASGIKPGFAFTAGFFVSKSIRKNLKLTAGINYNYYSTSLETGAKIDSNKSAGQYHTGTSEKYTNRFHFIEVPVTIEKQLGSVSRFSINAGLSFSFLAGSNALQYDGQKNIYYVDNSRINKMQWGLLAGFNYRLLQKKVKLEIGPQINYNLSNIFKKELYGSRHFFFAGIGTKIFFGKK